MGRVLAVHTVATYEVGYPLRDYALALYALREEEEQAGLPSVCQWLKSLLVCLPGKLGQLQHRWVDAPWIMAQVPYGEWIEDCGDEQPMRCRSLGGIVQYDSVDGFAPNAVPAIAGFVTSHGRIRLLQAIRIAGWNNVHYYDTDSVFVNQEGYDRLRASDLMGHTGLGALVEKPRPRHCEIRGVKYYVKDDEVTCAGLPRGHIVDLRDGVHYARYLSAMEQARRGLRPESVVVHGTYARAEEYRLGTVGPDGTVRPFELWEE
jgi:hypothetical protein